MKQILGNKNKGFSLIEVAIAIVVIGLIVGFTIKGKELIHTAKLNATIEQVHSIKMATQMFVERYGALPGSFSNAKKEISDALENGSGNGEIFSIEDAKRFWAHLAASDLISLDLSENSMPASKVGGYFSVSSKITGRNGIWIILSMGTSDNNAFQGIVSQEDAYRIDKKTDTKNPNTGDVMTRKAENLTAISDEYDIKSKTKDCVIMFRIW